MVKIFSNFKFNLWNSYFLHLTWLIFTLFTFDQLFQNLSQLNINTWIFTILFYHLTKNFMKAFLIPKSNVSLKPQVLQGFSMYGHH